MTRAFALALAAGAALAVAAPAAASTPQEQIKEVLAWSADAWSKGDLDRFMQSYEHGPRTAFVVQNGLLTSHHAIRDRYAAKYGATPGPAAARNMGRLRLDLIEVRMLAPAYALATGRFTLAREGQKDATGITTLLFHRSAAGWRIAYDHSS